jgi:hypothetical protein
MNVQGIHAVATHLRFPFGSAPGELTADGDGESSFSFSRLPVADLAAILGAGVCSAEAEWRGQSTKMQAIFGVYSH